ncbi:NAD-dependent epimerase/dehydratase family protein [Amycolatopsis sp. NPDC051071]|uniref:NAD-dependent epimerase/dehydratase family protein n=1 Tax=Amycolatopsis sp. NPDC051071 TaxID=3154637 RepID=UPI003429B6DD
MDGRFERALVTGGAGFVGSHLCERLLDDGTEVVAADNFATADTGNIAHFLDHPAFHLLSRDVTVPITAPGPFDVVFHLASAASPRDYFRLPLETLRAGSYGTEHALAIAERDGARFVLASTSEVYGDPREHPQREDYWGHVNPIGPRSVYDEAKRYAEALTAATRRERAVNTGIARIFNTYGPRMRCDDGRMIPTFITQALGGKPLTVAGTGQQTRSLCYVDDTVGGLVALAGSGFPGPVNLGNPHELAVLQIAEEIVSVTGSSSAIEYIDAAVDDPSRRCPDISLARRELGWAPKIDLAQGLPLTIDWYIRNHPLESLH